MLFLWIYAVIVGSSFFLFGGYMGHMLGKEGHR